MKFYQSKNFWANILNVLLVALVSAGVIIPDGTADSLAQAITDFNPFALGLLLLNNLILPIFKTVKNKSGNWKASLFSTNFWGQVVTFGLWIASFYGVVTPEGTGTAIAETFADQNWVHLIEIAFINIALPVLHIFVKPKLKE
jgi:hypothetical protein